jgi:hypothetical protein
MTLTFAQAIAAEQAFASLAKQPVAPKLAYRAAKWLRLLAPETKQFEEQRQALARQHGATDDQPVPNDQIAAFVAELNELAVVEVTIDYAPLAMAELESFPSICADDIARLGPCLLEE